MDCGTDAIIEQPAAVRVAVNGQLFGPKVVYAIAYAKEGAVNPDVVEGHGSIREGGKTLAENTAKGPNRYYFGRTRDATQYRCNIGNPPDDIFEGMGATDPPFGAGSWNVENADGFDSLNYAVEVL